MGVTLNKDGTPRKIGSGKTKGAGCYENITLRDLRKLVNENAEVSVSRVWLREAQEQKKARSENFDIKPPKVKPEYTEPSSAPVISNKIKENLPQKKLSMHTLLMRMSTNLLHFSHPMQVCEIIERNPKKG